MKRFVLSGCGIGLMMLLAGCAQTPPLVTGRLSAADERAIDEAAAALARDWTQRIPDKVISYYAENASVRMPSADSAFDLLEGKEAIRRGMKGVLDDTYLSSVKFTSVARENANHSTLRWGAYRLVRTNPETQKSTTEEGYYLTDYQKRGDGVWVVAEQHFTPNHPSHLYLHFDPAPPGGGIEG